MAFPINKVLTIKTGPFTKSVDVAILEAVEKLVNNKIFWIDYRELKPINGTRRFHILRAFNQRDK
jgi:hypothetical protein